MDITFDIAMSHALATCCKHSLNVSVAEQKELIMATFGVELLKIRQCENRYVVLNFDQNGCFDHSAPSLFSDPLPIFKNEVIALLNAWHVTRIWEPFPNWLATHKSYNRINSSGVGYFDELHKIVIVFGISKK